MYKIVNASTGIVVNRFTDKRHALDWAEDNNTDEKGDYLHLYDVYKDKDASKTHQKARSASAANY